MSRPSRVEVLCIGTELLAGKINTHVVWLAQALRGIGLRVARESCVPDSLAEIRSAVREAASRCGLLIVCGGLGPTFDDLTREGVSGALGLTLVLRPKLLADIRERFRRHHRRMPAENRRQAYVLRGARVLSNPHGSAPGQWLTRGRRSLLLLPGPPAELYPMFQALLPELQARHSPESAIRGKVLHFFDITESAADERLKTAWSKPPPGVDYTILAHVGQVDFHVTASGPDAPRAQRLLERACRTIRRLVGRHVFGTDDDTLESVLGRLLRARGLRLATAESCTAGLLSQRLTSVAGSSEYYLGGVSAYADGAKRNFLGVKASTLSSQGAVSGLCAREMAEGALRRLGADIAISITGIAGPGGGTPRKPVGLVYIGLAASGRRTRVERRLLPGNRQVVREYAAVCAMGLLLRVLKDRPRHPF